MMLPFLYRTLTWPLTPLAAAYLRQRRKHGKEDPIRFRERRGSGSAAAVRIAGLDTCQRR
jgi:hypothetical protein